MKKIIVLFAALLCGISVVKAQDSVQSKADFIAWRKKQIGNYDFIFEGRTLARYLYWDKTSHQLLRSTKIEIRKIIKGEDTLKHGTVEFYEYAENRSKDSTLSKYEDLSHEMHRCVFFCSKVNGQFRQALMLDTMKLDNTIRLKWGDCFLIDGGKSYETEWDSIWWGTMRYPEWRSYSRDFYKLLGIQPASRKEERYVRRKDKERLKRMDDELDVDTTKAYLRARRAETTAIEMKNFRLTYESQKKRSNNTTILRYKKESIPYGHDSWTEIMKLSSSTPSYIERITFLFRYDSHFYKNMVQKNKVSILIDEYSKSYLVTASDYDENTIMVTLVHTKGKRIRLDSTYQSILWVDVKHKNLYKKDKIENAKVYLVEDSITLKNSFYVLSDTASGKYLPNIFRYSKMEEAAKKRGGTQINGGSINNAN